MSLFMYPSYDFDLEGKNDSLYECDCDICQGRATNPYDESDCSAPEEVEANGYFEDELKTPHKYYELLEKYYQLLNKEFLVNK